MVSVFFADTVNAKARQTSTMTSNHPKISETHPRQDDSMFCGTNYSVFLLSGVLPVFESLNY